jgi:hypothetical protein
MAPPTVLMFIIGIPFIISAIALLPDFIEVHRMIRAERLLLANALADLEREACVRTDFPDEPTEVVHVYDPVPACAQDRAAPAQA